MRRVIAMSVALSGCVPWYATDTSRVSGIVIDAESKKPLAGAILRCEEHPDNGATADPHGRFVIPAEKKWALVMVAGDHLSPNCTLIAEAVGYRPWKSRVRFGDDTQQSVALEAAK